jgi:hypothetical protein
MHITDDELAAHYYGELRDAAEARAAAHLEECEVCRASLAKLKRVMAAIDMVTMPEPPAGFEEKVWKRLQPAVSAERPGGSGISAWKLGAWGSMAAGIILAAFVAGRMWPNEGAIQSANGARGANSAGANGAVAGGTTAPGSAAGDGSGGSGDEEAVRERVLRVDLGDHLDRTEQTLVEFVSRTDATRDGDTQTRSEDLVAANRLYRGTAEVTGDRAVTDVLDDLERVLIEIAGVPSNAPASELEAIRKRIDARDLLFKLRVMRMELEQRASDPRPAKRQGPTT